MRYEKSCGTIIIDQNKVLLIGAKDPDGEMFWSFPKGHQEKGETDAATALRETFEEVGLAAEIIDSVPIIVSHTIHDQTAIKDIYLFLARIKNDHIKPQPSEVEVYQWASFAEASKILSNHYQLAWSKARERLGLYNHSKTTV